MHVGRVYLYLVLYIIYRVKTTCTSVWSSIIRTDRRTDRYPRPEIEKTFVLV